MLHPIDVYVGTRIRLRRTMMGLSQSKLANALGLTFQQIQKYERGANRVGGSRLYELSEVLDVPPAFFFDGVEEEGAKDRALTRRLEQIRQAVYKEDSQPGQEVLELARAYERIKDDMTRERMLKLIKAIGGPDPTRKTPRKRKARRR